MRRAVTWLFVLAMIGIGVYAGYVVWPTDTPPAQAVVTTEHQYKNWVVRSSTGQRVGTVYAVALQNSTLVAIQVRSWGLKTLGTRWVGAGRIKSAATGTIHLTLSKDQFIRTPLIK
jgi:hypothetical protein